MRDAELRPIWPAGRRWRSGSGSKKEDEEGEVLTGIGIACRGVNGQPATGGPRSRMWRSLTLSQRHYSYIINHKKDHQTSQVSHSGSSNWPKASSPAGGPMDSDSSPSPALAGPHTGVPFS